MVHDPNASRLTAVVKVRHPAYVLLSPDEQARRVRGWGRVLAALAASRCARLQVLEIALPDSGQGIRGWWNEHGHPGGDDWAAREYELLLDGAAPSASTHRTLIASVSRPEEGESGNPSIRPRYGGGRCGASPGDDQPGDVPACRGPHPGGLA